MAKGDLWTREPGKIYPGDFTIDSIHNTLFPHSSGWSILEVIRVFHFDLNPEKVITETCYYVGQVLDPKKFIPTHGHALAPGKNRDKETGFAGQFLRTGPFKSLDAAEEFLAWVPHRGSRRSDP